MASAEQIEPLPIGDSTKRRTARALDIDPITRSRCGRSGRSLVVATGFEKTFGDPEPREERRERFWVTTSMDSGVIPSAPRPGFAAPAWYTAPAVTDRRRRISGAEQRPAARQRAAGQTRRAAKGSGVSSSSYRLCSAWAGRRMTRRLTGCARVSYTGHDGLQHGFHQAQRSKARIECSLVAVARP